MSPAGARIGAWLLAALLCACGGPAERSATAHDYRSFWAEQFPESLRAPAAADTLLGDFHAAAAATDPALAAAGWARFLATHEPRDGRYEDAMQARLVAWATLEQARLEALRRDDSDAVARHEAALAALAVD